MAADMLYDGTVLHWYGHGRYKATSGLPGHQNSSEQSKKDAGPIPEGLYSFPLAIAADATMIAPGQLDRREGIQHLPDKFKYGRDTYANDAWGPDRVRLTVIRIVNPKHRNRGGFYLHDSTKGYSHGCIEVNPALFQHLRAFVAKSAKSRGGKSRLVLKVQYPSTHAGTYGGTKTP